MSMSLSLFLSIDKKKTYSNLHTSANPLTNQVIWDTFFLCLLTVLSLFECIYGDIVHDSFTVCEWVNVSFCVSSVLWFGFSIEIDSFWMDFYFPLSACVGLISEFSCVCHIIFCQCVLFFWMLIGENWIYLDRMNAEYERKSNIFRHERGCWLFMQILTKTTTKTWTKIRFHTNRGLRD